MNCLKEGREEGNSLLDSGWRRSEQEAVLISYGIFCFSFSFFLSDLFRSVFSHLVDKGWEDKQQANQSIAQHNRPFWEGAPIYLPALEGETECG